MSGKKKSPNNVGHFAPKTRKLLVRIAQLVPDPNNPRFTTSEGDRVPADKILDKAITGEAFARMATKGDTYQIKALQKSIRENGWQPVDAMFVRRLEGADERYVVLEGNRRLTAINELLQDKSLNSELRASLEKIEVLEVIGDKQNDDVILAQITYLLGVRHHGSLKKWSPFAQAANIFRRYLELANVPEDQFHWDKSIGDEVASSLSIGSDAVRDRLKVYLAMRSLARDASIKDSAGGVKDRHYSIVEEALKRKELKSLFPQNDTTFELPPESVANFVKFCHFDRPGREGSPIKDPTELRALGKILTDEDADRRQAMLHQVAESKALPSEVAAKRSSELRQITWEIWLKRLHLRLTKINMGDRFEDANAADLVRNLRGLLERLKAKEATLPVK